MIHEQPLASWNNDNSTHPDLVWWSRLDNKYQVEVHRAAPYKGELIVFDYSDNDRKLASIPVTLSYDARFGPDVADVALWQEKAAEIVDSLQK